MTSPPNLRRRAALGWILPAALGAAWALLYLRLHLAGATPGSIRGLLFSADRYYLVASGYALPACLALAALFAEVARRLARLEASARPALRAAWALPLLACLVLPEQVALTVGTPATLKATLPWLGGLTLLGLWALPLTTLRHLAPALPAARRRLAVALALLATAAPMAALLR